MWPGGGGLKYFHAEDRGLSDGDFDEFSLLDWERYEMGLNVLRGVEVKVSRSDFRNGFVCSGCNYHYLLTPMRLVAPYEVPTGVGLIEYNRFKFSCEMNEEGVDGRGRPFKLQGLRVVRRPSYRNIPQFQVDNAMAQMIVRTLNCSHRRILEEVKEASLVEGLVYGD